MFSTARLVAHLIKGQSHASSHAERLDDFYAPQVELYDASREKLLHGRERLIALLDPQPGAVVIELGAGTGRNLEFYADRVLTLKSVTLVDLCTPLLEHARTRTAQWPNVRAIQADVTTFHPDEPADMVYFSYSLTMIPDWLAAIENAIAMLKPGGLLGVVDFYVSRRDPGPGRVRHGVLTRNFWRAWFDRDGVFPSTDHLPTLTSLLDIVHVSEHFGTVPIVPLLRVPYYVFVGRKPIG